MKTTKKDWKFYPARKSGWQITRCIEDKDGGYGLVRYCAAPPSNMKADEGWTLFTYAEAVEYIKEQEAK